MRTKKFQQYLEKRLSREEIVEIEAQVKNEIESLKSKKFYKIPIDIQIFSKEK